MGIMGEPMARNLLKSGKFASVTVWNRTASKARLCRFLHPERLPSCFRKNLLVLCAA